MEPTRESRTSRSFSAESAASRRLDRAGSCFNISTASARCRRASSFLVALEALPFPRLSLATLLLSELVRFFPLDLFFVDAVDRDDVSFSCRDMDMYRWRRRMPRTLLIPGLSLSSRASSSRHRSSFLLKPAVVHIKATCALSKP